jgi:hypothetical protein
MTTGIVVVLVIASLLAYVVYLHIQLTRKNIFIESTIRQLSGIEKRWNMEEMIRFLNEVKRVSFYGSFFTDRLFEEKPLQFLLENQKDSKIFIHYTREENIARDIIREGFLFADSFYKTAMQIFNDKLDLLVKHNNHKSFGDFIVIICISDKVFDRYSLEIEKRGIKGFAVENILTEKQPSRNENADLVYQLSNKFIKGYINHHTGIIVPNTDFDPVFDSPGFMNNIESLDSHG